MQFNLKITLSEPNTFMHDVEDVQRALMDAALRMGQEGLTDWEPGESGAVLDRHGNRVGEWSVGDAQSAEQPNPILVDFNTWTDGADIYVVRDTTQRYLEQLSDLPDVSEIDSVRQATSAERKAAMVELNRLAKDLLGLSS